MAEEEEHKEKRHRRGESEAPQKRHPTSSASSISKQAQA